MNNEKKYEEWKERRAKEEKFVEKERKEYESKKKELQEAIYANKYKLDNKYKKQVTRRVRNE